jgi:predicted hotdog family 3-hydroxylacyl-ACP dehydratase
MTFGKNHNADLKEPVTGSALEALLPQKYPFVFLSALTDVSETEVTSTFKIDATGVLCDNGRLNPSGLIENIAQTSAAKLGYECNRDNKKVPLGFIADLKDFVCTRLPEVGDEITTHVKIENKVFDITIVSGTVTLHGEKIASCKMKIFIDPNEQ